ncbi:tetratricopeptide repeat protein [Gilvimarinus sp. F26214L]|uniref:tetratricopeptide repeat protein n=1 Tax=Gilvimarinus sp. DZF01 TaxID=3461371 RepID=UPI004045E465
MNILRWIRNSWLLLLLAVVACSDLGRDDSPQLSEAQNCAEAKAVLVPNTGHYSRPIDSRTTEAQAFFDQGLRLTYSYYFPEAQASFDAALCYEPDHPMLHWGRALAIAPNPNSRYEGAEDDPKGAGAEAIARAQANSEQLPERGRALIEALAVIYDTETYPDEEARTQAFVDASLAAHEQHPDDLESAFLAAHAVMLASPWNYFALDGSPIGRSDQARAILERGIEQDSQHPGLNHLYIHLMENSREFDQAEASADRLESLTPRAGHMVHMPGHIYMRLGRYDDAIAVNERSLAADAYFAEKWNRPLPTEVTYGLSHQNHGGHARDFLQWGPLMQGNSKVAVEEAQNMAHGVATDAHDAMTLRMAAVYPMTLRAFGRWDQILAEPVPPADQPYLAGLLHWARGSAYLSENNPQAAERELAALRTAMEHESLSDQRAAVNTAADLLKIAETMLMGEIAARVGDQDAAIEHFRAAVAAQDQQLYMEPPDWMQSTRLFLGQAYLDADQPGDAEVIFRQDLDLMNENGWALYGLAQSLWAQGKNEEAQAVQERFEKAWGKADVELTAAHF